MALTTNESVEDTRRPSLNCLQITDLPEEILEFILLHLSPYRDLRCAMQVNRQWYRLVQGSLLSRFFWGGVCACSSYYWGLLAYRYVQHYNWPTINNLTYHGICFTGVIRQLYQNFYNGILEGELSWTGIAPEAGSNISERYSHCACYYDKSMYIFGGCTSTNTTFNDLWRFDLMDRKWVRPLAIGNTNYNRNHYYRGTTVSTSQSILIVAFTKFSRILSQCV